jgi:hypothetical protein
MKYLALTLLMCSAALASAQIKVELVLERKQYLPNEPLFVGARIINHSGQTLKFGKDSKWLSFHVDPTGNAVVQQTAPVPVEGEFEVQSSFMGTRRVDLTPCFDFSKPGRYYVTATVRVDEWGQQISSEPKTIEIFPGTTVWEQSFGVPNSIDKAGVPEIRKYSLLKANHVDQKRVYVQVADEYGSKVFAVFPVAPVISSREPAVLLDRGNNLHILAPIGRQSFGYYVVNPSGSLVVRQRHDYLETSAPRLSSAPDGSVGISGGYRKVTADDLPPRPESRAKLEVPPEKTAP